MKKIIEFIKLTIQKFVDFYKKNDTNRHIILFSVIGLLLLIAIDAQVINLVLVSTLLIALNIFLSNMTTYAYTKIKFTKDAFATLTDGDGNVGDNVETDSKYQNTLVWLGKILLQIGYLLVIGLIYIANAFIIGMVTWMAFSDAIKSMFVR